MAQGTIKSKKLTTATARTNNRNVSAVGPKKGSRTIAPRRAVLVQHSKITKKHSAGLTAMTERTLGAKAGHLELLKGGKKNKDGKDGKDAKGKPVEIKKGGTKKFG
ncbi:hypothetical protein BP6252_04434 [Coleophoma cylindrospora]|uniref:Uncharacterized protein n=1 Tax=Coleophoma cylindrospora TaxID=1849047 RepID=A0A3D8S0J5_9HELO|nr:hypothetical protein BP6252_04434 [Coleophoma cylindrospora]